MVRSNTAPHASNSRTRDGALHVDVNALVDAVILQRADHLEPRAVAHVREARVAMASEIALADFSFRRAVENGAPRLELVHSGGRLFRVDLGHPPVVQILAASHRVREMHAPVVAIVRVAERRRDAAFRHHRVRLAEERLRDHADGGAGRGRADRRAQSGATGADDEYVVLERFVLSHQNNLQSVQMPIEHMRMYTSEKPTITRLAHAMRS